MNTTTKDTSRDARHCAIMYAQFKRAISTPNEHIKYALASESTPWIWYILIHGIKGADDEFTGGMYLCKMEAPPTFPFNPPAFSLMTPNGVFNVNGKPCIHIGEFHTENYQRTLGMSGFAAQILSSLIGWKDLAEGSIHVISTTIDAKKNFAAQSAAHNSTLPALKLVEESYANYSAAFHQ
jgi:ubiquitin-protein ligase